MTTWAPLGTTTASIGDTTWPLQERDSRGPVRHARSDPLIAHAKMLFLNVRADSQRELGTLFLHW